jgi:hypothetical protein
MSEKLANWVFCIRENCPEGYTGKCTRGHFSEELREDFPADGRCLYPEEMPYDEEIDVLGAYEKKPVLFDAFHHWIDLYTAKLIEKIRFIDEWRTVQRNQRRQNA